MLFCPKSYNPTEKMWHNLDNLLLSERKKDAILFRFRNLSVLISSFFNNSQETESPWFVLGFSIPLESCTINWYCYSFKETSQVYTIFMPVTLCLFHSVQNARAYRFYSCWKQDVKILFKWICLTTGKPFREGFRTCFKALREEKVWASEAKNLLIMFTLLCKSIFCGMLCWVGCQIII